MQEIDEAVAKLKPLQGGGLALDVEYSIRFTTTLRQIRPGFPPVSRVTADVSHIRAVDGRPIQPGEYLLERPSEVNRVKLLDFGGWHMLSWPPG